MEVLGHVLQMGKRNAFETFVERLDNRSGLENNIKMILEK